MMKNNGFSEAHGPIARSEMRVSYLYFPCLCTALSRLSWRGGLARQAAGDTVTDTRQAASDVMHTKFGKGGWFTFYKRVTQ